MLLPSGARLEKWVKIGNFLVHARVASRGLEQSGEEERTHVLCMGSMRDRQAVFPAWAAWQQASEVDARSDNKAQKVG